MKIRREESRTGKLKDRTGGKAEDRVEVKLLCKERRQDRREKRVFNRNLLPQEPDLQQDRTRC